MLQLPLACSCSWEPQVSGQWLLSKSLDYACLSFPFCNTRRGEDRCTWFT